MPSDVLSQLSSCAAELAQRGMTPATSSNFSARLDSEHCHVTVSGRDKGKLGPDDFMLVDMQGMAGQSDRRASAETLLHTQIYRLRPDAGAVLHTHSLAQTVMSMRYEASGFIEFTGYELLKAFRDVATHQTTLRLPIVANSQDMDALCTALAPLFEDDRLYGYLIAGHGIYSWGRDVAEAKRHLDAFEFLLNAEMTKPGMPS
mgnify:FL=1